MTFTDREAGRGASEDLIVVGGCQIVPRSHGYTVHAARSRLVFLARDFNEALEIALRLRNWESAR